MYTELRFIIHTRFFLLFFVFICYETFASNHAIFLLYNRLNLYFFRLNYIRPSFFYFLNALGYFLAFLIDLRLETIWRFLSFLKFFLVFRKGHIIVLEKLVNFSVLLDDGVETWDGCDGVSNPFQFPSEFSGGYGRET